MGPNLTAAEGFILGVGAKMFSCCGAGDRVWCESKCGLRLNLLACFRPVMQEIADQC